MSFERGSVSVTIFKIPAKLPENAIELFKSKVAKKLDDISGDEVSIGWTGGKDLLELNINEETAKFGGYIYLNLRIAQRKLPSGLFNAECRKSEKDYMTANARNFVPGKVRRRIKEDMKLVLLQKVIPQISGIPFIIDRNMLYLGTASRKIIDTFLSIFHDTFQIELAQIDETEMTWNIFKTIENLPSVKFAKSTNKDDCPAGRDFLTWLWYFSEEKGGKLNCKEYGTFEIMIEGPLVFAKSDESEGSRETVVRKDNPLRSAEAKAALTVGKKLKKAKIWLVRGKEAWKCTLDADSFNFTGLTLPEGEKLDDNGSVFAERVNFLHIFQNAIREYFAAFALCLKDPEWPKEQERIIAWEDERHTC